MAERERKESSNGLPWHPNLHRRELDNGLKIVMLPNQYPKDRFYMYLDVNVGSICEEENEQGKTAFTCTLPSISAPYVKGGKRPGIAHFLEHLVFLGTEKWRTPDEMREVMAGLGMSFGGDTNASTDQKNTVYTCEAPAGREQIELVTEILYQVPCEMSSHWHASCCAGSVLSCTVFGCC